MENDIKISQKKRKRKKKCCMAFDTIRQTTASDKTRDGCLAIVKGYHQPNDGGGGLFFWDVASTETPDGGLIFQSQTSETGRWKRYFTGTQISVRWFGAVGTANDTAAIQKAVQQHSSIYFPPGTYRVSQIKISSNRIIMGAGPGKTVLRKLPADPTPLLVGDTPEQGNSHISIRDLSLGGNRSNQSLSSDGNAMGIRMDRWDHAYLRNLEIKDFATDGIYLGTPENNAAHFNEYVYLDNVHVFNSRRNNMAIISAKKVFVKNCSFNGAQGITPRAGIDIEPDSLTHAVEDLRFEDVVCANNDGDGFSIYTSGITAGQGIRIFARNVISINNKGRGFRVTNVLPNAGKGVIELLDCTAKDNGDVGLLVTFKSKSGPLLRVIRLFSQDNASGVIGDPQGERTHIKLYESGNLIREEEDVRLTDPGGIEIIDPYLIETKTDMAGFSLSGNQFWDDVHIKNFRYENRRGDQFWNLSREQKRIFITGHSDEHFKRASVRQNLDLIKPHNYAILDNTGATAPLLFTLPVVASRKEEALRFHIRLTNEAGHSITVRLRDGAEIVGLGSRSISSNIIGAELILENSAANKWIAIRNNGFG